MQSYFLFNFREFILKCLLSQPEGAFILRFSESKRRCLALSVRVPFTHNPTGVSHYLIIRNENGFKIKVIVAKKERKNILKNFFQTKQRQNKTKKKVLELKPSSVFVFDVAVNDDGI